LLGVTADVLRVNVDWNSAFLKMVGQFGRKFQVEGDVPHQPFVHGWIGQLMPYNLSAERFVQRNFVADFLPQKFTFIRKMVTLHF